MNQDHHWNTSKPDLPGALSDPASIFHGASKPVANQKWYPGRTYAEVAREIIPNELAAVYALQNADGSLGLQESYKQCQTNVRQGGPGDGFILCPCASPDERPLPKKASDNLIHYLKMARKHGAYPLRV